MSQLPNIFDRNLKKDRNVKPQTSVLKFLSIPVFAEC